MVEERVVSEELEEEKERSVEEEYLRLMWVCFAVAGVCAVFSALVMLFMP